MLGKVAAASLENGLVTGRPLTVDSSQPTALDRFRTGSSMVDGGDSALRERLLAAGGLPGLPGSPFSPTWRWQCFDRHTHALMSRPCLARYSGGTKVYCVWWLGSSWHSFD
eukprot:2675224-Prymnesium_polylepis.1